MLRDNHRNQREECSEVLTYLDRVIQEDDILLNIRMYRLRARISTLFHNSKDALNSLVLALNIARENNLTEEESEILILMAKHYQDHGKSENSLRFLEKSMEISTRKEAEN